MATDQQADAWGRRPGLMPPLRPAAPLVWFLALATALSAVVVVLVRPPGPLDQPDPAYQRDGLLLSGPQVARQVGGVPFGGRPVVVLFDRVPRTSAALATWVAEVPEQAEVFLAGPAPADLPPRITAVSGGHEVLAAAVRLPAAVDGGPGIGYAVVDADRVVRYSTLDPHYLDNGFELATIVGAVR